MSRRKQIKRLRKQISVWQQSIANALKKIASLRKTPANPTKISRSGTRFIAEFEGFEPRPNEDPVGFCSVGFGHLIRYSACKPSDHSRWGVLTIEQGIDLLRSDLEDYANAVRDLVTVPLNQNQFDALVSFSYNLGIGALGASTLLKVINGSKNQAGLLRNRKAIRAEFDKWVNAGVPPKPLPGLVRRRKAEADLFFS